MTPAITSDTNVFQLKPLSKDSIEASIEKAEHYRLLNQPHLAESICLDILLVGPDNQRASTILLLALSDQFDSSSSKAKQAMSIAQSLKDEYSRLYYSGIISERLGAAALKSRIPGSDFDAYEWYREAMEFFEKADAINEEDNSDPVLRWNTCARIIMQYHLSERPADNPSMLE
jgi:replication-associated recombination protein RarA